MTTKADTPTTQTAPLHAPPQEMMTWVVDLRRALWEEAERAAQARARAAGAESTLAERVSALRRAEARIAELEREIAGLRAAAEAERSRAADLEGRLAGAESGAVEIRSHMADLEGRLAGTEAYVDRIHRSKSWRVTEPLRTLSRILRRER